MTFFKLSICIVGKLLFTVIQTYIYQVVCLLLMTRDRIVGQRSSGLLFLFWLVLVIYGTIKLRTLSLLSIDNVR